VFELADVRVAYDGHTVLEVERLTLGPGCFTVLLGHNGSGKSTLVDLLARVVQPRCGAVRLDGRPLGAWRARDLARRIAHLPQRLPEVAGLNVRELCALGRFPWRGALGRWRAEDEASVAAALRDTGIEDLAERLVDELSGGERQRAWIAMLLAQQAPILLLDEPIAALDPAHQLEILRLLARLERSAGQGIVAVVHDVNLAARFADRILVLKRGRVAFDGSPAELLEPATLSALYDVAMEIVTLPGRARPLAVLAEDPA